MGGLVLTDGIYAVRGVLLLVLWVLVNADVLLDGRISENRSAVVG